MAQLRLHLEITLQKSCNFKAACTTMAWSSYSRMRVIYHDWSATKQRPHPQSVAEISRHSVLSGDRIRQCETSWLQCDNVRWRGYDTI